MSDVLILAILALGAATVAALLIVRELHLYALNTRVSKIVIGEPSRPVRGQEIIGWLSALGERYRRYYPAENLEQLRMMVQSSGFNPHRALSFWIGAKAVSAAAFPLAALFLAQFFHKPLTDMFIFTLMGLVVGIMGPRLVLSLFRRHFVAAIKKGTPDAIDLLVVCSEAGMGLESAVERVAEEMIRSNPPMARVLDSLLDDLRVLPNRRDAFEKLGATTEGLRRFATMIAQSLQYGTPLSQALRAVAEELRREALIRLEERAHQLGAKLILPMVLFMLPAMFVILGGSSFLHLTRAFSQ